MNSVQDAVGNIFSPPATIIFLAYDTVKTGRHAMALLDHVVLGFNNNDAFRAKLWRFDLVVLSECASETQADASDADVMMVSFGARGLPSGLFEWLGDWAEHRHVSDAALVAVSTGAVRRNGLSAVASLRSLARRHRLEFIYRDESVWGDKLEALGSEPFFRNSVIPPVPFMTPGREVPLSEWGLND